MRRFRVRHAIVSIGALDSRSGAMNYDLAEAEFGREVLACGERRLVVTDASKFGRSALVRVCGFDGFDVLVTDAMPPPDLDAALRQAGVAVLAPGRAAEADRVDGADG